MRPIFEKRHFSLLLVAVLAGCNALPPSSTTASRSETSDVIASDRQAISDKDSTDNGSTAADTTALDVKGDQPEDILPPIAPVLAPGTYCYKSSGGTEEIQVRLTIDSADRVIGNVQGTIHNDEESYAGYRQAVDGTIDGSHLNVDIATWINADKRNKQATWRVSSTELRIEENSFSKANCDQVNKVFQNENGLEAKDLTANANNIRTTQLFFPLGENRMTVSEAVARGDRDVYILSAQGGQQMKLAITAIEKNAVFDVVDPSGTILGTDLTEDTLFLPYTGDYQIIVGGARGNAAYDLAIAVE